MCNGVFLFCLLLASRAPLTWACPNTIPIVHYLSQPLSIEDLVTGNCPVVVRGSPPSLWPAVRLWSPAYFSSPSALLRLRGFVPVLTVKESSQPLFMYDDATKPLNSGAKCRYQKQNISMIEFFGSLSKTKEEVSSKKMHNEKQDEDDNVFSDETYSYFSDGISVLQALSQDILPSDYISCASRCDINVWAAQKHVTAYPHYDVDNNFFVQIWGRKRVVLVSPYVWIQEERLFPHLHTMHRQIQQDREHGVSVDLIPGDLLFIPAFWIHRVTSLEQTISVNFWCASRASYILNDLLSLPLPFSDSSDRSVAHYIRTLLKVATTALNETFSTLDLLRTRFNGDDLPVPDICVPGDVGNQTKFDAMARRVAQSLSVVDSSIQQVVLCDYAEEIVRWAVGVEFVSSFIMSCL